MGVAGGDAEGGGCEGHEMGGTSKQVGDVDHQLRVRGKPKQKEEWIANNDGTGGLSRGGFVKATVGSAAAVLALSLVRLHFRQLLQFVYVVSYEYSYNNIIK